MQLPKLLKSSLSVRFVLLYLMVLFGTDISAQEGRTISGKVSDKAGVGLPGVNVILKGTTNGTTTDLDGNYRIRVPNEGVLTFQYHRLATQEVEIGFSSVIDITMRKETPPLSKENRIGVVGSGSEFTLGFHLDIALSSLVEVPVRSLLFQYRGFGSDNQIYRGGIMSSLINKNLLFRRFAGIYITGPSLTHENFEIQEENLSRSYTTTTLIPGLSFHLLTFKIDKIGIGQTKYTVGSGASLVENEGLSFSYEVSRKIWIFRPVFYHNLFDEELIRAGMWLHISRLELGAFYEEFTGFDNVLGVMTYRFYF